MLFGSTKRANLHSNGSLYRAAVMSAPAASAPAPAAVGSTTSAAAGAPALPPGVIAYVTGRLKEMWGTIQKEQKPWAEVLDRNALSKPENLGEAASRIRKNATYFRVNYLVVILATTVVSFVMHPTSLLVLAALMAAWIYVLFIRQQPITMGGRELSHKEKLIGMGAVSFITIFFLTSVGTVFFSALAFSCAAIALHGAFREPDNLFVDDAESSQPFLGFLSTTPGIPNVGVAAV